jgi:hypothetical protein
MGTPNSNEVFDGPSMLYQGVALPDVRYYPANKDSYKGSRFPAFYGSPIMLMTDQIPQTFGTATIAAAQAVTTGTALTLVTTCPGGAAVTNGTVNAFSRQCVAQVPFAPFTVGGGYPNMGANVTTPSTLFSNPASYTGTGGLAQGNVLAIDFGYMVGTTAAGSATITAIPDVNQFQPGQWIVIGGAGNSANTLPLITQVITIGTTTLASGTMTVYPVPSGSLTAAPIGSANAYGVFPSQLAATAVNPYLGAGTVSLLNPSESLARGVSITANAAATGGVIRVLGFDVYGALMSEAITTVASTTVYGKKAFKYIIAVVPSFTDAGHTYSVGVSDVFGMHIRTDRWDYLQASWNGTSIGTATGFIPGVQTTPATQTTGDTRGVVQVSANGGGTAITNTSASDGVKRFFAALHLPIFNAINATPSSVVSMFGTTQV